MLQSTLNQRIQDMHDKKLIGYENTLKEVYKRAYENIEKELLYLNKKNQLKISELLKRDRLQDLKKQIDSILNNLGQREIVAGLKNIIQDGYYAQCFEIAAAGYNNIDFSLLDPVTIEASVYHSDMTINIIKTFKKSSEWKKPLEKVLKNDSFLKEIFNKNNRSQKIAVWNTLNQGLIQGTSYQKMASEIKTAFQGGYNDAIRVLRTEGHKCQIIGQLASIEYSKEYDVDLKEFWIATRDGRTRSSHKAMNKKFVDDDGLFTLPSGFRTKAPGLSGIAAEDINCRCGIGTSVDGIMPDEREVLNPNTNTDKFTDINAEIEKFKKSLNDKPSKKSTKKQGKDILNNFKWYDYIKEKDREEIEKLFNNMSDDALKFWEKYGDKLKGEFYAVKSGQGYYNTKTKKIYLALDKPYKSYLYNKNLNTDVYTFLHEAGHLFDNNIKNNNKIISSNIPDFKKLIREDFFNWVNSNIEKANFETRFKKYSSIQNLNIDIDFSAFLELQFKRENNKLNHLLAGVSDIFGGISKNAVNCGFYHPTSYWKGDMLEQEAFASMFQAFIFGGELENLLMQYLPKSYKAFKNHIKGVI